MSYLTNFSQPVLVRLLSLICDNRECENYSQSQELAGGWPYCLGEGGEFICKKHVLSTIAS